VHGSGALVRWLLENELVDEINLLTFPVIIAQGTRLFADSGPDVALDLVDTRTTPNGVTIQVFRPSGRPEYATSSREGELATKLGVVVRGRRPWSSADDQCGQTRCGHARGSAEAEGQSRSGVADDTDDGGADRSAADERRRPKGSHA
jgi:hypothetical protein